MPASSLSSMFSWGAYLTASAALLFMLSSPMNGVTKFAHAAEASRTLDGITGVLDGLRPGVSASLYFLPASPGDIVRLGGHEIAYSDPGFELVRTTRWSLPNASLLPQVGYVVWLENGTLMVTRDG